MSSHLILKVKEYKEIELRSDLIFQAGEVDIFPEILQGDYFSMRYRKGKLIFQAGGYLGLIPLNKRVSLEISAKVPISNLERMLLVAQQDALVLERLSRKYDPNPSSPKSIFEFLIKSFLHAVSELHSAGLLKFYGQRSDVGIAVKGRVDVKKTLSFRARYAIPKIAYSWSERNPDNGPNRAIKYILRGLVNGIFGSLDRRQRRETAILLTHFDNVSDDANRLFLNDILVKRPELISAEKSHYRETLVLGKLLLEKQGITLRGNFGDVRAASFIVDMEKVFEKYILEVLRKLESIDIDIRVLDGNRAGVGGGKKNLLSPSFHPSYSDEVVEATPDVILEKDSGIRNDIIIIEVKYKSIKNIVERADLNQTISYASSYRAVHAVLVLPAIAGGIVGLRPLGLVGECQMYQYFIDLNSHDISAQEDNMRKCFRSMFYWTNHEFFN